MRKSYFGILLTGFISITSVSDLSAQSPPTTAPPPLLAASTPPPVYFLTQGVWIAIRDKAFGFGTGTQLELVQDLGDSLRVKAGDYEFDVKRGLVTNDREVARQAYDTEVAHIAQQQQEKTQEQERVDQAVKRREERETLALEQAAQQAAYLQQEQQRREQEWERARALEWQAAQRQTEQERNLEHIRRIMPMREREQEEAEEQAAQAQSRQRASQEVDQLEQGSFDRHIGADSGIENDVRNARDSNLQNRFDNVRDQIEQARSQRVQAVEAPNRTATARDRRREQPVLRQAVTNRM